MTRDTTFSIAMPCAGLRERVCTAFSRNAGVIRSERVGEGQLRERIRDTGFDPV